MLILSLGWKTKDPYERNAQVAACEYECALMKSLFFVLSGCYLLGYLVTGNPLIALYFLLLPPLLNIERIKIYSMLGLLVIIFWGILFAIWFVITNGNILHALLGTALIFTISLSLVLITQGSGRQGGMLKGGQSTFVQNPRLTSNIRRLTIGKNFPPVNVYIYNDSSRIGQKNAGVRMYRGVNLITIDPQLYAELSKYSMVGVLAHELGHLTIPLGQSMFHFLKENFFSFGDTCCTFTEKILHRRIVLYQEKKPASNILPSIPQLLVLKILLGLVRTSSVFSSFPASQKMEYAADACSALILRDALPLATALIYLDDGPNKEYVSDTHPTNKARILRLCAIENIEHYTRQ